MDGIHFLYTGKNAEKERKVFVFSDQNSIEFSVDDDDIGIILTAESRELQLEVYRSGETEPQVINLD